VVWSPVEGLEFAEAQAGVEGGCPEGSFAQRKGCDEGGCVLGTDDVVAASADGRQCELDGRVGRDLAAVECSPIDRPHWQDRVSDRACGESVGGDSVGDVLEHVGADCGEYRPFAGSDYYAASDTPRAHRQASGLAGPPPAARRARGVSHVHHDPFDRVGSWLYPYSPSGGHSQHPVGHRARDKQPGAERAAVK
jgi:hypothetical protein